MSDVQVIRNNEQSNRLFTGSEKDARQFVRDNFPRVHAEPGALYGDDGPPADVVIVKPGQKREDGVSFNGARWSDEPDDGDDAGDADDAPAPRKAAARKSPAKKTTAR